MTYPTQRERVRDDIVCIWHHYHRLVVMLATGRDMDKGRA